VADQRQIGQLYGDAASCPPTISLARSGNNLIITCTGTLLSSTNVTGSSAPVTGASSPYTTAPNNAQMFYRARH
jgi:hypothetical protein